eukprot:scpid24307/ scgid21271/ Unconventional myosin-Id
MGDLEASGWEKELARHVTKIHSVDDLVPILKENFGSGGPVCVHINSSSILVLHSYSSAVKKESAAPKKLSLGRAAGRSVGQAVSASPSVFPIWLDGIHKSLLSVVQRAYARLTRFGRDACIVLSGESGAGKTVCCKACLGYLASFSPVCRADGDDKRLGNLLVVIGPLLDAFGNAATTRNDNSSRFGKTIGTVFDFRGHLIGAKVIHYMLERNRVTQRKVGERNFHIFYQLLKGAPGQLLRSLFLKSDASNYQYLARSGGPSTAGATDKSDFAFVLDGLRAIGLGEAHVSALWQLLAAILHLGQLKFEKFNEGSTVLNRPLLRTLSPLLGLEEVDIEQFLCFQQGLNGEVRIRIEEAVRRRDVLAQALYDQVFLWLIQSINGVLRPQPDEQDRIATTQGYHETFRNINFIDLYGFAQHDASSFEQMCMNYSCEKLQQAFLCSAIKGRIRCFQEEGVPGGDIQAFFTDNACVCDLFDNTNEGVFTLLDRATCDPQEENRDKMFLDLMDSTVSGHDTYTSRQVDPSDSVLCPFLDFRIRHFAGGVTYTIDGFVSSNMDIISDAISDLFMTSTNVIAKDHGIRQTRAETTPNSTVGVNFRNAITNLTDSIEHQDAYHVRCMKPNVTKSPNYFDEVKVRQQCEDQALCEAIIVEQAGHATQVTYSEFFGRYRRLSGRLKGFRGSVQEGCKTILKELVPNFMSTVTFGHSLIFLSAPDLLVILNGKREELLKVVAVELAHYWQKHRLRKCLKTIHQQFKENSSSLAWPPATPTTAHLIAICQKAHRKWLYNRLLKSIPASLRPDMRLKATGYTLLGGRRQKWGHSRRWHGDYLSVNPTFRSRLKVIQKEAKFEKVLFSSAIRKVNTKLKVQDRCILVTEQSIVFVDDTFAVTKQPMKFNEVTEIQVTSGHDQAVVLVSPAGRNKRDWVFSLQQPDVRDDFIGEMVSVICHSVTRLYGVCPHVTVDQQLKANIGGDDITVDVDYQFNAKPEFKKTGSNSLTLLWPA